jgi:hypothetical protein
VEVLQALQTRDTSPVARTVKRRLATRLPILPSHHVYVWAVDGDGHRFCRLFQETWRRIDLRARRRILRHWREDDSVAWQIWQSPSIVLLSTRDQNKRNHSAGTRCLGHGLRFCSADVDEMPDDVVRDLIAYELAHVYLFALGIRYGCEGRRGVGFVNAEGEYWGDIIEIEDSNARFMSSWGFDSESMNRWANSTGRV